MRFNLDGSTDSVFRSNFGTGSYNITDVAIDSTGQTYAIGNFTAINGIAKSKAARLNATGSVDLGFIPPVLNGYPQRVFIDNLDRAYLVGDIETTTGAYRKNVIRLLANGDVDTTFNFAPAASSMTGLHQMMADSSGNLYFCSNPALTAGSLIKTDASGAQMAVVTDGSNCQGLAIINSKIFQTSYSNIIQRDLNLNSVDTFSTNTNWSSAKDNNGNLILYGGASYSPFPQSQLIRIKIDGGVTPD
jgi:hypothetical protein